MFGIQGDHWDLTFYLSDDVEKKNKGNRQDR